MQAESKADDHPRRGISEMSRWTVPWLAMLAALTIAPAALAQTAAATAAPGTPLIDAHLTTVTMPGPACRRRTRSAASGRRPEEASSQFQR
jgi:hypothetical protein